MAEMVNYEDQPDSGGGKFLNLKAKGDKATIRLLSQPITYFVHWTNDRSTVCENKDTCKICQWYESLPDEEKKKKEIAKQKRRQVYIWPVVDRADGEVKVFKGGIGIFLAIREFAIDPKWGGPDKDGTRFDVTVIRTETSLSNYYSVVPDPTSLNINITDEEMKAAGKLGSLIDSITTSKEEVEDDITLPGEKDPEGTFLTEKQPNEDSTDDSAHLGGTDQEFKEAFGEMKDEGTKPRK